MFQGTRKRRRRFDSPSDRRNAQQRKRSCARRLGLEPLEARQMLSAAPLQLVSHAAGSSSSGNRASFIEQYSFIPQDYTPHVNPQQTVVSQDGRYIAFVSDSTDLVSGVTFTGAYDVFRYDRLTGNIDLVSLNAAGAGGGNSDSGDPVISADGSVVAFVSTANNLSALDNNGSTQEVFARDFTTNTTSLVSVNFMGTGSGNRTSYRPAISADGRVVAFISDATNLSPLLDTAGGSQLDRQVFARNLTTDTTSLVSVNFAGTGTGNGWSGDDSIYYSGISNVGGGGSGNQPPPSSIIGGTPPAISADGSVVAFESASGNLISGFIGGIGDVYVRNLNTSTTTLVSSWPPRPGYGSYPGITFGGNGASSNPVISADGNVVAFQSFANGPSDFGLPASQFSSIFIYNLSTRTLQVVAGGNGNSSNPVLSADGSVAAYQSSASNLPSTVHDSSGTLNVYAWSLATGATSLVSVNSAGTNSGNADSDFPEISADGTVVVFDSYASDLAPLDTNRTFDQYGDMFGDDVFARNLTTRATALLSMNAAGTASGNGNSSNAVISADGLAVAFTSDASDLVAGEANGLPDVFLAALPRRPVSPRLVTTASLMTATDNLVGSAIPEDSAVLSGGYHESGPITFTLIAPDNTVVDTETVAANGDGTYSTSNTHVATQAGTYTWKASYAGDSLNHSAQDQGGAAEQVTTVGGSVSGFVYFDANNNGLKDAGEKPYQYEVLFLTGTDDLGAIATQSARTDASGAYTFWNLRPGTYTVTISAPNSNGYLSGLKSINNVPIAGSANTDSISGILVGLASNSPNNNFAELVPGSLSGAVYIDANNNGLIDPGEPPLGGVTLTLTGTDDDVGPITAVATTTGGNGYSFGNLRPGSYTVTETQPTGYVNGLDSKNNVPISGANTSGVVSGIPVIQGANSANNNFGELPRPVQRGDFASIGFWQNKNGQALINSLNGGPNSTGLARWLGDNFPNLYGPTASPNNMETQDASNPDLVAYLTNSQVAALYTSNFFTKGSGPKTNAQILAAALAVYSANPSLAGGAYAAKYGFNLPTGGTGNGYVNIGSNGAAFGVPNNTKLTVLQMLRAVNAQAVNGVIYAGSAQQTSLANMANNVFDTQVNSIGNISLVTADAAANGANAPLIDALHPLVEGTVVVAVDALPGDATEVVEEQARVDDAIASLNGTLGPRGVTFDEIHGDDSVPADVHVHFSDTSVIGGVDQGVLGVTEAGGEITIINGWNFFLGSDSSAVGANQYDFQTVVTHELGHSLGLGHSADTSSVMFPYLATGAARRSLTNNDLQVLDSDGGTAPEPLRAAPALQPSAAVRAYTAIATAAAASTSTNVNTSTSPSAHDAVLANTTGFGGWAAPLSSKADGAGAQLIADTDSLDALFEVLNDSGSDALQLGKSNCLLS
jgi:Tol biopolymer transport system component